MLSRILIPTVLVLSGCAGKSDLKDSPTPQLAPEVAAVEETVPVSEPESIPYHRLSEKDLESALPEWAVAELKRESEVSPKMVLELGEEHRFSVLGTLDNEPTWDDEKGLWYFEVGYQGESPMECFVFNQNAEPFNRLTGLHDSVLDWYKPATSEVEKRVIIRSGMHVEDDILVAGLDYLLRMSSEGGEASIGLSQGRVAYNHDHVLSCIGVTFGYRETQERIFNEMVSSWELTDPNRVEPYFRQLHMASMHGHNVGFVDYSFEKDSDGDTVIRSVTSLMIKYDHTGVSESDVARLEYSTAEGHLINAYSTSVTNGELEQTVSLSPGEGNEWFVEGTVSGKPVEFTLETAELPSSALGEHRTLRALLENSDRTVAETVVWNDTLDVSSFGKNTLTVKHRETDNNLVETVSGPITIDSIVQDSAMIISAKTQLGSVPVGFSLRVTEGAIE